MKAAYPSLVPRVTISAVTRGLQLSSSTKLSQYSSRSIERYL
jgi:hypothetical protein